MIQTKGTKGKMILTAQKIMRASRSMPVLSKAALPYRYARQVNRLNQWLREESESIVKTQADLVKKHNGTIGSDGSIVFTASEAQDQFMKELTAQFQEEIDYDAPVCDLRGGCDDLSIRAADIAALEGLVLFD